MNTKTRKRLTIALAALAGFVVFTFASMEWTSRSEFCDTCHYMEPFYMAWQNSAHSDVACVTCHYPPGILSTFEGKLKGLEQLFKYATRSYLRSKPWAEIPDASCLRSGCHDSRLLQGKAEFKEGIVFDHTPHLTQLRRGKKLRCTSCHSQIVQGEHITVTPSTCFLCHFKGRESEASSHCTQCHDAPVMTPERQVSYDHTVVNQRGIECQKCHGQMVVGDGAVPLDNCEDCHFEKEKLDEYSNTELIHNTHITQHKIECQRCHLAIQHKSVSRTQDVKPECQSCHTNMHSTQEMLFHGQGGRHVDDHPSPMYTGGLNCQGCHIFHQANADFVPGGETVVARRESCEPCHGPGYSDLVEAWRDSTDKRLENVGRSIERVERELRLADSSSVAGKQAWQALDDARYNYQLVEYGKSVHNITYADRLLQEARHLLTQALDMGGSRYRLAPYPWTGQVVPGECASCHDGIEAKTVETSTGLSFNHGVHLAQDSLSCRNCHSNMRRHGEVVMQLQTCLTCHHEEMAMNQGTECASCHQTQAAVFSGAALDADMPDIMAEAGLECSQCHTGDDGEIVRPAEDVCATCHGDGYGEILQAWQTDTGQLLTRLEELIVKAKELKLDGPEVARALRVNRIFTADGSRGAHNSALAEQYLSEAADNLEEILPKS